jgi:hypothetical protein
VSDSELAVNSSFCLGKIGQKPTAIRREQETLKGPFHSETYRPIRSYTSV